MRPPGPARHPESPPCGRRAHGDDSGRHDPDGGCRAWADDLDLYALGALTPARMARIEQRAAACPRLHARLRAATETAAALGLAVPLTRAPRTLRVRVLRQIHAGSEEPPRG